MTQEEISDSKQNCYGGLQVTKAETFQKIHYVGAKHISENVCVLLNVVFSPLLCFLKCCVL